MAGQISFTDKTMKTLTKSLDEIKSAIENGGGGGGGGGSSEASKVFFNVIGTKLKSNNVQDAIVETFNKSGSINELLSGCDFPDGGIWDMFVEGDRGSGNAMTTNMCTIGIGQMLPIDYDPQTRILTLQLPETARDFTYTVVEYDVHTLVSLPDPNLWGNAMPIDDFAAGDWMPIVYGATDRELKIRVPLDYANGNDFYKDNAHGCVFYATPHPYEIYPYDNRDKIISNVFNKAFDFGLGFSSLLGSAGPTEAQKGITFSVVVPQTKGDLPLESTEEIALLVTLASDLILGTNNFNITAQLLISSERMQWRASNSTGYGQWHVIS